MRRCARNLGAVLLFSALACSTGCDLFIFTPKQRVKQHCKQFGEALSAKDWRKARTFCSKKMFWQTSEQKVTGPQASMSFFDSLRHVDGLDEMFIEVDKMKEPSPGKMIAHCKFEGHIVVNSMQLRFAKIVWYANLYWVKTDIKKWTLVGIKETSARKR